jgi:hypothetical protein
MTDTPAREAAWRRFSISTRIAPFFVTGFCGLSSRSVGNESGPKL